MILEIKKDMNIPFKYKRIKKNKQLKNSIRRSNQGQPERAAPPTSTTETKKNANC